MSKSNCHIRLRAAQTPWGEAEGGENGWLGFRQLWDYSASPCGAREWSRGESNPRAPSVSPENHASSQKRAAPGAARGARGGKPGDEPANGAAQDATGSPVPASGGAGGTEPTDPDLARVAAAWAGLPEAVRRGIVAMVEGVGGDSR